MKEKLEKKAYLAQNAQQKVNEAYSEQDNILLQDINKDSVERQLVQGECKEVNVKKVSRSELAMNNFLKGYKCAQSVVLAFADIIDVDTDSLIRISSSFGGGMGRLREVCGSVSGMFIVAGYLYGYSTPETGQIKANHYSVIQELAHTFEQKNKSIVCRELLGLSVKEQSPVPEARTQEYYKKRPCKELIGMAAQILENYINEHPYKNYNI